MTKISKRNLDPSDMGQYINNIWNALTLMESKDEVQELVKDLFTHTEYKMFAKRLEIARRLLDGRTYEEIKDALKVTEKPIVYMSNILANSGNGIRNADIKLKQLFGKSKPHRLKPPKYKRTVGPVAMWKIAAQNDKRNIKKNSAH